MYACTYVYMSVCILVDFSVDFARTHWTTSLTTLQFFKLFLRSEIWPPEAEFRIREANFASRKLNSPSGKLDITSGKLDFISGKLTFASIDWNQV